MHGVSWLFVLFGHAFFLALSCESCLLCAVLLVEVLCSVLVCVGWFDLLLTTHATRIRTPLFVTCSATLVSWKLYREWCGGCCGGDGWKMASIASECGGPLSSCRSGHHHSSGCFSRWCLRVCGSSLSAAFCSVCGVTIAVVGCVVCRLLFSGSTSV